MNRRDFLTQMTVAACLTSAGIIPAACQKKFQKPNIILVMADDQGWGDTGYNGHPFVKTPNLDKMSEAGLRFDRFYAAAPVCSPTRASVLTGRHPFRSKVLNHGHYMRPQEETIAEALKRAGYVTAHFGKWHVGSVQKQSPVSPGNSGFDEWISAPNFFDLDPYLSDNGTAKQFKGESSKLVMDWTLDFINRQSKEDRPFFAVAWFASPHLPHHAIPPDDELYQGEEGMGYFQEITALDRAVGRLRNGLRELGIHDNTLLWYNSDNGGLMSESSGGRGRKGSVYEGGLRVPAIIEWPTKIVPRKSSFPAFTSDIYPTLLEIASIKQGHNHPLDGISLKPLVEGRKGISRSKGMGFWHQFAKGQVTYSDRIVRQILEAQARGDDIAMPERLKKDIEEFPQYSEEDFPGHSAWIEWPWKIHRIAHRQKEDEEQEIFELYNLVDDPMEENNLASEETALLESLKTNLRDWQASVMRSLNGKDYDQL